MFLRFIPLSISILLLLSLLLSPASFTISCHETTAASSDVGSFFSTQYVLPFHYNIILIGFDGTGNTKITLNTDTFHRSLDSSLDYHTPHSIQNNGVPTDIQYKIHYHIHHYSKQNGLLEELENYVSEQMVLLSEKINPSIGRYQFDIESKDIEEYIEKKIYQRILNDLNLLDNAGNDNTNMLILFNPDKNRLKPFEFRLRDPMKENLFFDYYYKYGRKSTPAQLFISKFDWIFIDFTAGPCEFGVSRAGVGSVLSESVPSIETNELARMLNGHNPDASPPPSASGEIPLPSDGSPKFIAQLTTLCIAALRHVFLPDMQFKTLKYAEKVVIPIVLLRNHRRFSPLTNTGGSESLPIGVAGPDHDFKLDIQSVQREVKKFLLPSQELLFVWGTHNLYDHKLLSQALWNSLKQDTIHEMDIHGVYHSKSIYYFDSKILLEEVENSADRLVESLIQSKLNTISSITGGEIIGSRILPVFYFSLLGFPNNILFDHQYQFISNSRLIIALQTPNNNIPIPYFISRQLLTLNAQFISKSILSGLGISLGGLLPFYHRWDNKKHEIVQNYLFSTGCHLYGPFTDPDTLCVSQLVHYNVIRNNLLSRISSAYRSMKRSIGLLREFYIKWIGELNPEYNHFNNNNNNNNGNNNPIIVDSTHWNNIQLTQQKLNNEKYFPIIEILKGKLSSQQGNNQNNNNNNMNKNNYNMNNINQNTPLPIETISRLIKEINIIEIQFRSLRDSINSIDLNELNQRTSSILSNSKSFEVYINEQLNEINELLICCIPLNSINPMKSIGEDGNIYDNNQSIIWNKLYQWILLILLFIIIGIPIIYYLKLKLPKSGIHHRNSRNYQYSNMNSSLLGKGKYKD